MAVDKLPSVSDSELIEEYNKIGEKCLENLNYELDESEMFIMSAMSKRRLIHKSEFNYDLPSKWDNQYSEEAAEKRRKSIEYARQHIKNRKDKVE